MCDAVGSFNQQPRDSYPLAEQIVGSRWRVTPTAGFVGGASGTLQGVSCAAADACTAVGNYVNRAGQQATLAEREVAGRWSVQSSPTPRGATGSTLTAVSCATDSACAAVGQYCKPAASCDADPPGLPLAEIWDGSHWSTVPVPEPPGSGMGQLGAVSCATPTWCIAVGYREVKGNASLISPLIEVWNGSNWTSEQGPVPPNSNDTRLGGVSCSSPTACTAVGSSDEASGTEPFVEVWDGSSWAVRIPPANEPEGRLEGVSCWAPLSCVAVGEVFGGGTLIETSAGSVWSATTNSGAGQPSMAAVSCQPADDCLAVGDPISHAMGAIGWEGQIWAAQEVAGPVGTTQAQFNAVSCPPAGRCVAVGEFATNLNQSQPLIEERP
jgi:hypothetical protein